MDEEEEAVRRQLAQVAAEMAEAAEMAAEAETYDDDGDFDDDAAMVAEELATQAILRERRSSASEAAEAAEGAAAHAAAHAANGQTMGTPNGSSASSPVDGSPLDIPSPVTTSPRSEDRTRRWSPS